MMRDALRLYKGHGAGIRAFVRLRHLLSPLEILENWVSGEGKILDIGCGHGLFTNYMALKSPSRQVLGIDPSPTKIGAAKKTESLMPNVHYLLGEISDLSENGSFDAITIVDVLYLLPESKQREIMTDCYRLLSDSGTLILKTQDTRPRWRYALTLVQEKIMVGAGATFGDKNLHFMPVTKARRMLREAGFQVEYHRLPSRIFYPNVVFICRKETKTVI